MSDFANLLGKLQATAQKANTAEASTRSSSISTSASSKKRKLGDVKGDLFNHHSNLNSKRREKEEEEDKHTETAVKTKTKTEVIKINRPRDFSDLTIHISFLCIGAQKAGTTWLHEMLSRHPGLCLPKQKEVHFWDWNRRKGLRWYSNQFQFRPTSNSSIHRKREEIHYGEITPCYAVLPEYDIAEIKYLFPNVKIIFLARDLVERAWSALLMELRNAVRGVEAGRFSDNNSNNDGMTAKERQQFLRDADPNQYDDDYFTDRLSHGTHSTRNNYAQGIRQWLKYFSKDQILILPYSDVSKRPRELLKELSIFIGIGSTPPSNNGGDGEFNFVDSLKDEDIQTRYNVATDPKLNAAIRPALEAKLKLFLTPLAKDFNMLLEELGYSWRLQEY